MKLFVRFKYFIVFIMLSLCRVCPVQAQQNPDEVVLAFGKALSSWCKTNNVIYRKEVIDLCSGIKSCRVEDKMHADYQRQRGLTNYETFVLDSYLNMFQSMMSKSVKYQMSNVKVVGSDEMPEGTLTFITADITVSGALNHTVTDLFLVRNNKITGIYSYSSNLGFSHLNGSLIRALQVGRYIWCDGFYNGYSKVINEAGYVGLIDIKGEVIVPCIWDGLEYYGGDFAKGHNFKDDRKKTSVVYDLRYGGRRTPLYYVLISKDIWGNICSFSEGYAVVSNNDGKYGYLRESDHSYTDVQYVYDSASAFKNGYAYVVQNGIGTIIDKQFSTIIRSSKKYQIIAIRGDGLIGVIDKTTGKYGFVNYKGSLIIPCEYCYINDFNDGLSVVGVGDSITSDNVKFGCINTRGEIVIPIIYDFLYTYKDGYTRAMKNGKETLLGLDNKPLPGFSWEYSHLDRLFDGCARVHNGSPIPPYRYGYLDSRGQVIVPLIYEWAQHFSDGIACVGKSINGERKYGGINTDGVEVIPFIYDDRFIFQNGIALVQKDGKIGLIDKYGNSTFMQKEE